MIELKKQSYEKLIRQLVFLEENSEEIKELLMSEKLFVSKEEVQKFFNTYITKIESIIGNVVIVNGTDDFLSAGKNLFPFIVIDSSFTLKDRNNTNLYCYLTSDPYENGAGISHYIYAFSETGLNLLLKEKDDVCSVNLGDGRQEFLIRSIRLY